MVCGIESLVTSFISFGSITLAIVGAFGFVPVSMTYTLEETKLGKMSLLRFLLASPNQLQARGTIKVRLVSNISLIHNVIKNATLYQQPYIMKS